MDPLSIAASSIAVYQLCACVGGLLFHYTQGTRHMDKDVDNLMDELLGFQSALRQLKDMVEDEMDTHGHDSRLQRLDGILNGDSALLRNCQSSLNSMKKKLEDAKEATGIKAFLHRMAWPLKDEEVKRLIENMTAVSALIDQAQSMDTTQMVRAIDSTTNTIDSTTKDTQETTKRIETTIMNSAQQRALEEELRRQAEELKELERTRSRILIWLKHANPFENHHIACDVRDTASNTGRWLLDGDDFARFKKNPRSLLWLHGEAGCGKTILSCAIIEELKASETGDTKLAVGFWYFSQNDKARTNLEDCMKGLICQFIVAFPIPSAAREFWLAKKRGTEMPKLVDLITTLKNILKDEQYTYYIVLDALDEATEDTRAALYPLILELASTEKSNVRIMVTSRHHTRTAAESQFNSLADFIDVSIERAAVDADIKAHIEERLKTDSKLSKWPDEAKMLILETLLSKSEGMFRWVSCQLESVRECKKLANLDNVLKRLPKNIHEQYERDLAKISEDDAQDALKLLKWLTFPQRKIRLEEARDMLAVDLDGDFPEFNVRDRIMDSSMILTICGSLIRTDIDKEGRNHLGDPAEVTTIATSHQTVIDYLTSRPIKIAGLEDKLTKVSTNLQMAETSLGYLLTLFRNTIKLSEETLSEYPFARMCAQYWDDYYREIISDGKEQADLTRLNTMILQLLDSKKNILTWVRLCNPNDESKRVDFSIAESYIDSPLYYASLLGLTDIVNHYLKNGAEVDYITPKEYGTPLVAACSLGRIDVVKILLAHGANPTLGGHYYWGCPLGAATESDQVEIVELLLEQPGVDINCRRFEAYEITTKKSNGERKRVSAESMVYIAACYGSPNVMTVLLKRNADPNLEGGKMCSSLQAACVWNRPSIATQLLSHGAKADIYGGEYGSALNAAARKFSDNDSGISIVKKIIDGGCDVNHEGPPKFNTKTALCAATKLNKPRMVKLLLERGANPNVRGCGPCDNALQYACQLGDEKMFQYLRDYGADLTLKGGDQGNCLSAACASGNEKLVKKLLDAGMSPNEKGGPCDYPLIRAAVMKKTACVQTLLEAGADPMRKFEEDDQIAIQVETSEEIIALLVDKVTDIDFFTEGTANVLWRSAFRGDESTCRMLLRRGASPKVQHKKHGTPICGAVNSGKVSLMKLFVENGADFNLIQDSYYFGNAMHGAAFKGHQDLLKYLMGLDTDINATHWKSGAPIMVAVAKNKKDCFNMLANAGALLTTTDMMGKNPLMVAARTGHVDLFEKLIALGAKLDLVDNRGCNVLHYAARMPKFTILLRLIELGVDVNSKDNHKWTPLHWAAASSACALGKIDALLKAGADRSLQDKDGKTALDLAVGFGKIFEAQLLACPERYSYHLRPTYKPREAWLENYTCDGCRDSRWHRYHCTTCDDFDFCARCMIDKESIHFPDHLFTLEGIDNILGEELSLDRKGQDVNKDQDVNDTKDVIEMEPPKAAPVGGTKVSEPALPTSFEMLVGDDDNYKVEDDLIEVSGRGSGEDTKREVVYLRGNSIFPPGPQYFEITIVEIDDSTDNQTSITIGLAKKTAVTTGHCGAQTNSFGYHSLYGRLLHASSPRGVVFGGRPWSVGDTIGCGFNPETLSIFFTHSGRHLGDILGVRGPVFPVVTVRGHAKFRINFGPREFVWKGTPWDGVRLVIAVKGT